VTDERTEGMVLRERIKGELKSFRAGFNDHGEKLGREPGARAMGGEKETLRSKLFPRSLKTQLVKK